MVLQEQGRLCCEKRWESRCPFFSIAGSEFLKCILSVLALPRVRDLVARAEGCSRDHLR